MSGSAIRISTGTIGGTILSLLPNITSGDLVKTAVLAFVGAVVSFVVSMILKWIVKAIKSKGDGAEDGHGAWSGEHGARSMGHGQRAERGGQRAWGMEVDWSSVNSHWDLSKVIGLLFLE